MESKRKGRSFNVSYFCRQVELKDVSIELKKPHI
jgi:hypothetical protein